VDARLDQGAALGERHPEPAGQARRFGRRAFLGALGGGALALLLPLRMRPGSLPPILERAAPALAAQRFRRKLPIPRTLRGADLRIPIRQAGVRILPGRKTKMWTYGGTFPGPTIRRRAGEQTKVTFVHKLPKKAGELTVHLHGGHNRSEFDGQPGGLTPLHRFSLYCRIPAGLTERQSGNGLLLRPGRSKTYTYDLIEDGGPERAAFQWYHDHRLDHTGRNVWKGLAGMWIIEDDLEDSLDLPAGDRDIPLLIADRSLNRKNQLTNPSTNLKPPNDGVTGSLVLVNGALRPHHAVSARRYRLRILNASNFRSYNLALSNGARMVQIASDSGLMPRSVKRRRVLLGPAERAEVIVDFSGAAGRSVVLESVRRHDGERSLGSRPYRGPLMQFRVGGRRRDTTHVPRKLRPLPDWTKDARKAPDRSWVITLGGAFFPSWQINGKTFDPARADAHPVLGTTETWQVTNKTKVTHIFHLHHTDWYLLARNGKPPKPWEHCLKETFFVEPGDTIRIAGHFSDFVGKYVIHCHMLDHEDHGLMTQFEVVVTQALQPAGDEVARRRRGEIPTLSDAVSLGLPEAIDPGAPAVEFTPEAPGGERLSSLVLAVNGEDRLSLEGAEIGKPVALARDPGPLTRVTAVAHTADGRVLGATRDYPAEG
jgi:FtsP/CotA-like multicopper oxidase with cupredoxin domain